MALVAVIAAACSGDSPTGGDTPTTTTQSIEIDNVFANQPAASQSTPADGTLRGASKLIQVVEIRKIRLTVYAVPSNEVLFQNTFDVDPTASHWTIPFTAPVGASVRLVSELMSVTNGAPQVEYSGQAGPLTITPCTTSCNPIPIQNYPGPVTNLDVQSVAISVDTGSVNEGATLQLSGTATPANPAYVALWTSLDTTHAKVSQTGLVTGIAAGTARIVYGVGAKRDTATITVRSTCAATAYTLGTTVSGSWTDGDCLAASGSGRRYDMYQMTLTQQTRFRAQVSGPAGRRISLRRAEIPDYLQVMASEAAMPATSNPLEVDYVLPAGSYIFEIANPDAATLGTYTLKTVVDPTPACSILVFTTFDVTINGELNATDCAGIVAGREDRYIILPDAGVRVDLSLAGTAIAPTIVFRDDRLGPASPLLTLETRGTVGETAHTAYTTTFGGFHEIVVNNSTSALGAYSLAIGTASTSNSCVVTPSSTSGRTIAFWEASDCKTSDGSLYDRYTFTLGGQAAVRLSESSTTSADIVGIFTAAGTEVLEWLGGSSDFDATWYLPAGQYEIRTTQPASAAGTQYTLERSTGSGNLSCQTNSVGASFTFAGQSLAAGDCTFQNAYEDRLALFVQAGQDISVDMTSVGFAPAAIIRDPASTPGTVLVRNRRDNAGSVSATWHVTTTGYYQVIFSSDIPNATGTYSGSVSVH
jgi:hypothetical protein